MPILSCTERNTTLPNRTGDSGRYIVGDSSDAHPKESKVVSTYALPHLVGPDQRTLERYRDLCKCRFGVVFETEELAKQSFLRLAELYLLFIFPTPSHQQLHAKTTD